MRAQPIRSRERWNHHSGARARNLENRNPFSLSSSLVLERTRARMFAQTRRRLGPWANWALSECTPRRRRAPRATSESPRTPRSGSTKAETVPCSDRSRRLERDTSKSRRSSEIDDTRRSTTDEIVTHPNSLFRFGRGIWAAFEAVGVMCDGLVELALFECVVACVSLYWKSRGSGSDTEQLSFCSSKKAKSLK